MNINFIVILLFLSLFKVKLKDSNYTSPFNSKKEQEKDEIAVVIELNDSNFDSIIQDGNNNRWFILFYLETCYHCHRAKEVLNRILELRDYEIINNIKFAEIEININSKSDVRFNISKTPYIILVENNTMYELDLYPNEKNLKNFISTDLRNVTKDLKPFPHINILKYHFILFKNTLSFIVEKLNEYLEKKKINFKFSISTFILGYIFACFAIWTTVVYLALKCTDSRINNIKKNKSERKNNSEIKEDKINNDNTGDSEEKKKIKEEEKEIKEAISKENNIEYNKNIGVIKKEKKKKKE